MLSALLKRDRTFELVAVNDLTGPATLARLLAYDNTIGRLGSPVTVDRDALVVDSRRITVSADCEPARMPWAELDVDIVLEATGRFTLTKAARAHLDAGARKVLVSAPLGAAEKRGTLRSWGAGLQSRDESVEYPQLAGGCGQASGEDRVDLESH